MLKNINYLISKIHLTSNPKQTIVAMLGVVFGISMYIFMTGFMTGVNNAQTDLAFSSLAHIRIYNDRPKDNTNIIAKVFKNDIINLQNPKVIKYTDGIENPQLLIESLKKEKSVKEITTQVNVNVFFKNVGNKINGVISGVEINSENSVFQIEKYITHGNWFDLNQYTDGIILGEELADNLSLKINDNISVLTSEGINKNYKVIGFFKTGVSNVDKTKAYVSINSARQLIAENYNYVTDIQINVSDFNTTSNLVRQIQNQTEYKVESWQMSNQQLVAASLLRDIIAIAVSLTILLVAGFGIYNIMNMTINQKIKEIAILKAIGFTGKDITTIFLTQAIVIGVIGGVIGMLFGLIISYLINGVPFQIASLETLPMDYNIKNYLLAFLFGIITTFIAGYIPARKASKVDPVTIIRG